jgi:hypothetical protein
MSSEVVYRKRGACSVCEQAGRVWHFDEEIVARVNGFEITASSTLCRTCLTMLVELAKEDSTKPS